MEKKSDNIQACKSKMELENRKKLSLTGVDEVMSFDDEKIVLNTILGKLKINGQGLKMNKLDVKNGDVIIEGHITSMIYSGKVKRKRRRINLKKLISR
ncbi:sporulation protein YabP [Clostridium sardiniense]|uniref:sporulation protein YabP n=1 Tax=Clostridium sardiniense TaxID=29369 RepID=UPI003D3318DC